MPSNLTAIDLFCGAGGLTRGLEDAGVDVAAGFDIDPYCKYPYERNNKAEFIEKSVADLRKEDLEKHFDNDSVSVLAACAPCQTFSRYYQKAKSSDERWWLLKEVSRLIDEVGPDLITVENVPGLQEKDVFQNFVENLKKDGRYEVSNAVIDCYEYGVPQIRQRLVLLASRLGPVELLSPSELDIEKRKVEDIIRDLPRLNAGETHKKDRLHKVSALSDLNLRRIKSSKPNGSWKDWDPSLVAACHNKDTGKGYRAVYGRMSWEDPAPTVTTQFYGFGNGRFGHPSQDRALSLREGALLQGFPAEYEFVDPNEPIYFKRIGKIIGNAVPVQLGKAIGLTLIDHVNKVGRRRGANDEAKR